MTQRALVMITHTFVFFFFYMQEFAYIIVFTAYQNNGNHCETTKKRYAHFQEHNLKKKQKDFTSPCNFNNFNGIKNDRSWLGSSNYTHLFSYLFLANLLKMGFIEQLVGLLQAPQNASNEHVINLLKTLLLDYPQAIKECQRPEFDLEKLLTSMITSYMEDDPDLHEVNIAHTAIL